MFGISSHAFSILAYPCSNADKVRFCDLPSRMVDACVFAVKPMALSVLETERRDMRPSNVCDVIKITFNVLLLHFLAD